MSNKVKVKILLDADVIIHFARGDRLSMLSKIMPSYQFTVLDFVLDEINEPMKTQLEKQIHYIRDIYYEKFEPKGEQKIDYIQLKKTVKGKGESACMIYCKYNKDIVGSSNFTDIKRFCNENNIPIVSTLDLLWHAIYKQNLMSIQEAQDFITEVIIKGSDRLPNKDMSIYKCDVDFL